MCKVQPPAINRIRVYIDNIEISKILNDGAPIPDPHRNTATLKYHYKENDEGQKLVEKAIYGKNEIHEYKVVISNTQTWIYDGEIYSHDTTTDKVISETVYIRLNGKFKYIRDGIVVIERDFEKDY